jgi:hypothetical protein
MEKLKEGEDVVRIFEEILELELHEYQKKQLAMLLIGNTLTHKSLIHISDMFKYYADVEEVPDEKTN